eukprot:g893.t1
MENFKLGDGSSVPRLDLGALSLDSTRQNECSTAQELELALAAYNLLSQTSQAQALLAQTQQGHFTGVVQCWDMSSLKRAISVAVAGTGQVQQIIHSCVFSPREQAFTSLIKLCGSCGEWQKAIEIFEAMHFVANVRPNTYTYSALIAACSTSGQWQKALEVYELMKVMSLTDAHCRPNKVTFCAIISACEKGGFYDRALKVFQEMVLAGVPVDEWSLRAALSSCQKTRNWNFAEQILLYLRNCKSNGVLPQALAKVTSIEELRHTVNVWLSSKNIHERQSITNQPQQTKLQTGEDHNDKIPDITGNKNETQDTQKCQQSAANVGQISTRAPWDMDTLKSMIFKAKAGSGEIAEALKACTFVPRAQAFTTLINLCGRMREWEKAIEVFEAMEKVRGVKPNTYTYSALIAACSSSGEWEKALAIFRDMKSASLANPDCAPNEVTYSTVITACQRGGLVDTAMELYEEMLSSGLLPDQGSFNSILSAVERNERFDMAEKILADMHRQGLTGNPSIYCELIDCYSNTGNWSKIISLYEQLQRIQGHPEEAVRQEVIKALSKSTQSKLDKQQCDHLDSHRSDFSNTSDLFSVGSRTSTGATSHKVLNHDNDPVNNAVKNDMSFTAEESNDGN